jgi:hypothetical protein
MPTGMSACGPAGLAACCFSISAADTGSTSVAYFGTSCEAATTAPKAAGSSCAISDIGGRIMVRTLGVGTPLGLSPVTSASPMPSCVSSCSSS